jgi:phytoene desaturase
MSINKKVIIIGAGLGGLATASRLAKKGFQVTVVEKNEKPGGRCNYFEFKGHSFDIGPTLYVMPDLYKKAFEDLDENIEKYLNLNRVDPTYNIYFKNGSNLTITNDEKKLKNQLESIEFGSHDQLKRYFSKASVYYDLSMSHLINKEFLNPIDFFNFKNLILFFKLKIFSKHYNYVSNFFKDHRLKMAFTFQDFYLGLNPYNAPPIFSMLPYIEYKNGVWLPEGGMYSIVESLFNIGKKLGVKFIYKTSVNKIKVNGNKASGIILEDGKEINADIIVANADLTYVYQNLLPKEDYSNKLNNKKYSCSTISFFWGIDKQYSQLGIHNVFLSGNYPDSFKQIINNYDLPEDPNFYIHSPVRLDSSRAPEGQDSLVVIMPVGHINNYKNQNWNNITKKARNIIFKRLALIGITDIEKHIKFEKYINPNNWKNSFNLTNGSTLGLAHNLNQLCYMRPKNRHKFYKNLYFVGASTHPGSGLPIVLLSSRLTCQRILRENEDLTLLNNNFSNQKRRILYDN